MTSKASFLIPAPGLAFPELFTMENAQLQERRWRLLARLAGAVHVVVLALVFIVFYFGKTDGTTVWALGFCLLTWMQSIRCARLASKQACRWKTVASLIQTPLLMTAEIGFRLERQAA